jgi:hypothetical protein
MSIIAKLAAKNIVFVTQLKYLTAWMLVMVIPAMALETNAQDGPVRIGASLIEITYGPGELAVSKDDIRHWIEHSAAAVADFYHGFPATTLHAMINPRAGNRISGVTYRGSEPLVVISLGAGVTRDDLDQDWVITHEMVHLAFPPVLKRHHWIEEGLATYVEPLARSRAGLLSEEKVWRWFVDGMPKGLPKTGDRGLDRTPTWGRTYWGGALFCLLADIEIRQRTANRFALDDALRAIVAAGGTMQQVTEPWSLIRALEIGDRAVGVTVLMELYGKMKADPAAVDLADLWRRLGIKENGKSLEFDDTATLAALRRTLTLRHKVVP